MRQRSIGLTLTERNALILWTKGGKREAAISLGWKAEGYYDESWREFMEKEIARIREKVNGRKVLRVPAPAAAKEKEEEQMREDKPGSFIAGEVARIEGRIAELNEELAPWLPLFLEREKLIGAKKELEGPRAEEPERLDEREAAPPPPPGEKLDEREPDPPPPPGRPPERPEEPEDYVPTPEQIRDWVCKEHKDGEPFRASDLRKRWPALTPFMVTTRMNALLERAIVIKEGERGGTRYRYNTGPRPGEERSPTRNGSGRNGSEPHDDLATGGRGRPVARTGRRMRAGTVGAKPA